MKFDPNKLLQVIGDLIEEGVIVYGSDYSVHAVNRAAESILSIAAADVVGQTFSLSMYSADAPPFAKALFPSLTKNMKYLTNHGEYPQIVDLKLEKEKKNLRLITVKISTEDGPPAFLKIVKDRTDDVAVTDSKYEFVRLISHQLRTPITAINWTLQALQGAQLDEGLAEMVKTGTHAASELSSRINDIIELAKIESQKADYTFSPTDISVLLQSVIKDEKRRAEQHTIALTLQGGGSLMVLGDQSKLHLALAHFVRNAVLYNPQGGSVTVSSAATADGKSIEIHITDTGIGFDEEEKKKVFSKYFRGEKASEMQPDGNGLGLFIARYIINAHSGTVRYQTERGRGTTFTITLPMYKSDQ